MKVQFDTKQFMSQMNNLVNYSVGFVDGIQKGKKTFLDNLGRSTVESLKDFVDSMARVDQAMLHHVYEWNRVGSPNARLFDIEYTVSNLGLSLRSTFRQSTSVKEGSNVPFYDKARIMEEGIPVTIRPKKASVLAFTTADGEQVFTPKSVTVANPGGEAVVGGYEKAFDTFMNNYFTQAFLNSSGILDKLKDISIYKQNLEQGSRIGKSKGRDVGYRWIVNAGVIR